MSDWLDAEGHADRAFEMYERGRWAEAESELRKALSLNPDQAEWHFNLGLTLEAAGRDAEALSSYERAVELMPDQADPILAAGIVANRLDLCRRAVELFQQVLRIDPRNEAAYANKIDSHVRLGEHDEAETTYFLSQHALEEPSAACLASIAESLIERKLYARAAWCLKEALRLDPGIPRLLARLGAVYASMGKPQRALQLYLRDLRDDPGNIDTLLDYGELLLDLDRLPEAAEKFRRVLELQPANVDAHMRLGEIAMRSRRYEEAHLEFELVLKLDREYPLVRLWLADAMIRRSKIEEARQCLLAELNLLEGASLTPSQREEAEDLAQDWLLDELIRFGSLLLEAGLPHEAARVFERAAVSADDDLPAAQRADLYRHLAVARFAVNDLGGGVSASRSALRYEPRCIASIHNLALAALQEGRLAVCNAWIKRGMNIDRHDDGLRRLRIRLWFAAARAVLRKLTFRH